MSSANQHDSTKFIDVMESISDYLDNSMMDEIVSDPDYLARYRKLDYFTENYYLR